MQPSTVLDEAGLQFSAPTQLSSMLFYLVAHNSGAVIGCKAFIMVVRKTIPTYFCMHGLYIYWDAWINVFNVLNINEGINE